MFEGLFGQQISELVLDPKLKPIHSKSTWQGVDFISNKNESVFFVLNFLEDLTGKRTLEVAHVADVDDDRPWINFAEHYFE